MYNTTTGEIVGTTYSLSGEVSSPPTGHAWIDEGWPAYLYTIDIKANPPVAVKRATPLLSPLVVQARAEACDRINTARDQAANAGFAWHGHQFDSDAGSIQKINGAATLALLNPAFETDWILADNTIIHLTNADIRSLGETAGAFVQGLVFKARTLKDQAIATTTVADCTAVNWT